MNERIVILDFGSQYTQVIARRIRECNVFCVILPFSTPAARVAVAAASDVAVAQPISPSSRNRLGRSMEPSV